MLETRLVALCQTIGPDIKDIRENKADRNHTHIASFMPLRYGGGMRHVAGAMAGTSLSTVAITANRLYLIPFVLPRPMRVSSLAIEVTTASSGSCALAIYRGNHNDQIIHIVLTAGMVDTGTTGTKLGNDISSFTFQAETIYYAAMVASGTPTIRGVPPASQYPWFGWQSTGGVRSHLFLSHNFYSEMPTVITNTLSISTGNTMPAIFLIEI